MKTSTQRFLVLWAALTVLLGSADFAAAQVKLPKLEVGADGLYWVHFTYARDLAVLRPSRFPAAVPDSAVDTQYATHALRVEPEIRLSKVARFRMRLDGSQDAVWGANEVPSNPLAPERPDTLSEWGRPVSSVSVPWLYGELNVDVAKVRVGRIPSHWGMGLLLNNGGNLRRTRGGIDDDFGDNGFPTVYDGMLVFTDLVHTVGLLSGRKVPKRHALYLGYAYHRLVTEEAAWGRPAAWPEGDLAFLSRDDNDLEEHAGFVMYRWKDPFRHVSSLSRWGPSNLVVGVYGAYRFQKRSTEAIRVTDTASGFETMDCTTGAGGPCGAEVSLAIIDPYLQVRMGRIFALEGELFLMAGTIGRGAISPDVPDKTVLAYGWVARIKSSFFRWLTIKLEGGAASGDKNLRDDTIRTANLHPDHNVGVILYDLFLRHRVASLLAILPQQSLERAVWGRAIFGGVTNSYYFSPTASFSPFDFLTMRVAVLTAWAYAQDGFVFPQGRSRHIGTELDLGLDLSWGRDAHDTRHLFLRLEGGYLLFGRQVSPDYDAPGTFGFRARLAFVL